MQFLDNYNYFGYLKGASEVNRQYLQQAVLLCLLKALYYAVIYSYAACIILCPELCWHNSPRPSSQEVIVGEYSVSFTVIKVKCYW